MGPDASEHSSVIDSFWTIVIHYSTLNQDSWADPYDAHKQVHLNLPMTRYIKF